MHTEQIQQIMEEVEAASSQDPYEAVDILWVALVKAANFRPGTNEHQRMLTLVQVMPAEAVQHVVHLGVVNDLLDLDPPLETVLSNMHERLNPAATQKAIATIRARRRDDPRVALVALGEILKRIRNKRAHGFKTRKGQRDGEVLSAAKSILLEFCRAAIPHV